MRISDVLMDGEDDVAVMKKKYTKYQCLSPRLLFSGWVKKGKKSEKVNRENGDQTTISPVLEFGGGDCPVADLSDQNDLHGEHAKRDCVNLAVGFGLFYLISASKNELSKMIELRRDMELIVQSAKNEFQTQTRKVLYEPSESNNKLDCSTIDAHESFCSDGHFSIHNLSYENQTETLTNYSCDQSLTINTISNEKCVEEIDQLEAELETELERLQLRVDISDYPRNRKLKMPVDDSFSEGSSSESFVEAVDIQEADSTNQFGVCPHELERKLHELLQSRQQDKIKELEAALKRANQKLMEREREVSWWKDTAKMFSHHVPKASRLSRLGQASHRVI